MGTATSDTDSAQRLVGDPFDLARIGALHASQVARDVRLDESTLHEIAAGLDVDEIQNIHHAFLGENWDIVPDEFRSVAQAVDFTVVSCLLQFGHGFRYDLHRLCGRGASRTIAIGARALHGTGDLDADRLQSLTVEQIREAFQLPVHPDLEPLAQQLGTVLNETGRILAGLDVETFYAFCERIMSSETARDEPAATLTRELANNFPAFNDQGQLHDGSRVVLLKKATLAIGELRRLAAPHDVKYGFAGDLDRAVAPVDNVIPAMLVYRGVLRLSPSLRRVIHEDRAALPRGPKEAEIRAVALAACEKIAEAADHAFTPLDLGYYLWCAGKEPGAREFPRHHTKDTVFY